MHVSRATAILAALILCALVCDCGGGPYTRSGSGGGGTTNASVGGIWTGTDPVSQLALTGLIDEAGVFHFIRSDGAQYVGTAATNGTTVTSSFNGYTANGQAFADGSRHGTGQLNGTVSERSSITATFQFTTEAGATSNGTLSLTFNSNYSVPSALGAIAGNYTDPSSGDVYSITSSGAVTWQDATTGCVGNGTITIINATYNMYQFDFDMANCTGSSTVFNGTQFTGFATLDSAVSPAQLLAAATGTGAGVTYSLVVTLNHT
jgi:hypothetical protein